MRACHIGPALLVIWVYEPAMIVRVHDRIDSVYAFSIDEDAIEAIRVVRNPDKLTYIARQLASH